MAGPVQTERFIRFQLEQLSSRNEHHTFEEISFRIAERRLSSNLLMATGPVSAGGDQGRDAETYYTSLPQELPGAGGFIGRATTKPLVVAASVQRDKLEAKVRTDLKSICGQGRPVGHVAFFAVHAIATAARHRLQEHAQTTYGVILEVFDGENIARMLAHGDLIWVAERWLDLPANLLPDAPAEPQPGWYVSTLNALRGRQNKWLTAGTLSEIRNGLRHSTFDDEARVDLPEWLRYMREFVNDADDPGLANRARYECVIATLCGMNTLGELENDIRAVIDYALTDTAPSQLEHASVMLLLWGGAWARCIADVTAEELTNCIMRVRARAVNLLDDTDESTHPVRTARLLEIAATLCLQPRWIDVDRPTDTAPLPYEKSPLSEALEAAGTGFTVDPDVIVLLDVPEAMELLNRLTALLPRAKAFPLGTVSKTFQIYAPALIDDPRYVVVRDALDIAEAETQGDTTIALRARDRGIAFMHANRPLDALREMQNAKIKLWHGDLTRGSLLAMRYIGYIYAELGMGYAAKQYALAAACIALLSENSNLKEIVPDALAEATEYTYRAGAWSDALALARVTLSAHFHLAEQAFDFSAHATLQILERDACTILLASERFRPDIVAFERRLLGDIEVGKDFPGILDDVRSGFQFADEADFMEWFEADAFGRPLSDLGANRTAVFSLLGTTWWVTSRNSRQDTLAAERLMAAAQILLVDLAAYDPLFMPQDVHVDVVVGPVPLDRAGIEFSPPRNQELRCTVTLSPPGSTASTDAMDRELLATLLAVAAQISALPENYFMDIFEKSCADGLLHKLSSGRPYDELAILLSESHYKVAASVAVEPLGVDSWRPTPPTCLDLPTKPGPGYDEATAVTYIRNSYASIPTLISRTLSRALADPETLAGLRLLRGEGWLDWHLLIAMFNAALNFRIGTAGLLDRPSNTIAEQQRLSQEPEDENSSIVPLDELTPYNMRVMLDTAVFAIGRSRWQISPSPSNFNSTAFRRLLDVRYGLSNDVPHRDLLTARATDGTVLPLLDV